MHPHVFLLERKGGNPMQKDICRNGKTNHQTKTNPRIFLDHPSTPGFDKRRQTIYEHLVALTLCARPICSCFFNCGVRLVNKMMCINYRSRLDCAQPPAFCSFAHHLDII